MFSTLKQRLILGAYIFILLSIPIGSYLASQNQTYKSQASEPKKPKITTTTPKATASPAKGLLNSSKPAADTGQENEASAGASSGSPTIANSYGPTLSFKAAFEGRPKDNQTNKLFVGIAEGTITTNPKFLLSFSIDLPATGEYSNLSLAGLTSGSTYTALLKGSAQIATASAFTMTPNITILNEGLPINLISGDLNEDNVVNSADYSIAQKAQGATSSSANWNENADLNKDGLINAFDLVIIAKNIGQVGASGAWTSPIPKVSSPSASLTQPSVGGPMNSPGPPGREAGHWIWVPSL